MNFQGGNIKFCINYGDINDLADKYNFGGILGAGGGLVEYCLNYGEICGSENVRRNSWKCN